MDGMTETVSRRNAIREVMRMHNIDRETATALVDKLVEAIAEAKSKGDEPVGLLNRSKSWPN